MSAYSEGYYRLILDDSNHCFVSADRRQAVAEIKPEYLLASIISTFSFSLGAWFILTKFFDDAMMHFITVLAY